jgi:chromosome segregation ATPase
LITKSSVIEDNKNRTFEKKQMEDIAKTLDSLETNLITVVNELKASTEVILRELTLYLSASARDLSEIRRSTVESESILKHINSYIEKLDFIENKLIELPQSFSALQKLIEDNKESLSKESVKIYNSSMSNLKQVATQLNNKINDVSKAITERDKNLFSIENKMSFLSTALNEYKIEMSVNQERMAKVISDLIKNKGTVEEATLKVKKEEVKSNTEKSKAEVEKYKAKMMLWVKIIGILGASGGIVWLIVSAAIKALTQ